MSSIFDASANLKQLPESVVRQYQFTEEESVLCLGLVQGKTLDDMADEFHLSRAVIRSYYHRVLQKTGADNEAKLVSRVLSDQAVVTY